MILLIVPSRGRPKAAAELVESWRKASDGRSRLLFCLDDDDETLFDYRSLVRDNAGVFMVTGTRKTMCGWTNKVAIGGWVGTANRSTGSEIREAWDVYASLGDDHRLEPGFESHVYQALHDDLRGPGIVYGDDGIQGPLLPTCAFVSAAIVDVLGYMVPLGIEHLYADNFWLTLGREADCLRYLPHMRTPHLHPLIGGSPMDALYEESGSEATFARDGAAFDRWVAERKDADVAKVRALRAQNAEVTR